MVGDLHLSTVERIIGGSTARRGVALVGAFVGAFVLAWLAVVAVFLSLKRDGPSNVAVVPPAKDGAFADAVAVTRSGTVLSVAHHPLLNPSQSDFMLFVWFKLRSEMDPEERSTFLGKYDPKRENPEGYALALIGGADGVRPHVYWQNGTGKGRWFAFASTHIIPERWYVMAVTFRAGRYLGVHIAPQGPEASPEVLGGYDLDGEVIPASTASLSIGAFKRSQFRGQVGPFGVFQDIDISKDASSILKRIARDPSFASEPVEERQIALWASPVEDLGPLHLTISD